MSSWSMSNSSSCPAVVEASHTPALWVSERRYNGFHTADTCGMSVPCTNTLRGSSEGNNNRSSRTSFLLAKREAAESAMLVAEGLFQPSRILLATV
jgi:hypothetical protein